MARGNNRRDLDDDAPWLAEAAPRAETRVSKRSFFWTLAILLTLAAVAAIGLVMLMSKKDGGSTQGYMEADQAPLIAAEPGPYKQPPIDPKGLQVEGQDQTIYAAGEGIDAGSTIDQSAMPEAVLPRPGTAPATPPPATAPGLPRDLVPTIPAEIAPQSTAIAPKPPAPKPLLPPPAATQSPKTGAIPLPTAPKPAAIPPVSAPKPAPAVTIAPAKAPLAASKPAETPPKRAATVQLGAFSSPEKADAAWAALAGKPGMAGFGKRISKVESNGQTLYRLRASGGDAAALCAALKSAGQPCSVVE